MAWANRIILFLNICLIGALSWIWLTKGSFSIVPGAWEYKDLISILLTAVTVVLAFIGFIVGGAAIWGYQSIRAIAEEKAEKISAAGCNSYLNSQDFFSKIDTAIRDRLESEAKNAVQNALAPVVLSADSSPEFQEPIQPEENGEGGTTRGDQKWQD
jgi:hypothetical protein